MTNVVLEKEKGTIWIPVHCAAEKVWRASNSTQNWNEPDRPSRVNGDAGLHLLHCVLIKVAN
jgi:hypothetical protein